MVHRCTKIPGCIYEHIRVDNVVVHENRCSPAYVARKASKAISDARFTCIMVGCPKIVPSRELPDMHLQTDHAFEPQPCPEGCMPERLYMNQRSLNWHMGGNHSDKWPTFRRFPECDEVQQFPSSRYWRHLMNAHCLTTAAQRKPYLPMATVTEKKRRREVVTEDCDADLEDDLDFDTGVPQAKKRRT